MPATATMPNSAPTTAPAGIPLGDRVGKPVVRVDGWAKVTGHATYAVEAPVSGVVHAVAIGSTIAKGTVRHVDTAAAERSPGVVAVYTADTLPKVNAPDPASMPGESRPPLADGDVHYAGQIVAVVVAATLDGARAAASLVKVDYAEQPPVLATHDPAAKASQPKEHSGQPLQTHRGDVEAALATPGLTVVRQTYTTPTHTHNPIEMSGTVASWDNGRLTVWDATQGVANTRDALARAMGVDAKDVRVLCPFVGGGFGGKGSTWPHTLLAAAVARAVGRPVKLALTRHQMFTNSGHRPPTEQAMVAAATADGKLVALAHDTTVAGSALNTFIESCGTGTSRLLYAVPNLRVTHTSKAVNVAPPTFMRAPGESPGSFALECALDELAVALKMDPVQLRLANYAERHPDTNQPWSSKHLGDCYRLGVERFGWADRDPAPRSTRSKDGRLVGYGMATAGYPALRFPATARIRLVADAGGLRAIGASATQDLGTGAYTVFTQMVADLTGLPLERTKFELGDSDLPKASVSGGSSTTASVGQAIADASLTLRENLIRLAGETFKGLRPQQVRLLGETLRADDGRTASVPALIATAGRAYVEGLSAQFGIDKQAQVGNQGGSGGEDYSANQRKFAFHSFGAHFVEVSIDPQLPRVQVERVVSVIDVGKIVNPRTSRSQVLGGVIMGLGMALMEETAYDPRTGRPVTNNLAEYQVCTEADVRAIDVQFVEVPDYRFNVVGCRGVGEIGITGVAAAVANAVYHATGKRVRDLPITPDKLL